MISRADPPIRKLQEYLAKHHVAHVATAGDSGPHVAPVFYALIDGGPDLVWISDPTVLHSAHIALDGRVALSVAGSRPLMARIRGVQMRGRAECPEDPEDQRRLSAVYLAAFPLARPVVLANPGHRFYRFRAQWARLVETSLGRNRGKEWNLQP